MKIPRQSVYDNLLNAAREGWGVTGRLAFLMLVLGLIAPLATLLIKLALIP